MRDQRFPEGQSYYETAQVCRNGHLITDYYRSSPELRKQFCPNCGAPTIFQCPNCGTEIQGHYIVPGVIAVGFKPHVPSYCHDCGQPYPWTEAHLEVARQLTFEAEELKFGINF